MPYNLICIKIHESDMYDSDDENSQSITIIPYDSIESLQTYLQKTFDTNSTDFVQRMLDTGAHVSSKTYRNETCHYFIKDATKRFSCEFDSLLFKSIDGKNDESPNHETYLDIWRAWNRGDHSGDIYHMILYWINANRDKCD